LLGGGGHPPRPVDRGKPGGSGGSGGILGFTSYECEHSMVVYKHRQPGCCVSTLQLYCLRLVARESSGRDNRSQSTSGHGAPSEARKRGSGGGSPRKYDDLLTGRSDLAIRVKTVMEPYQSDSGPSEVRKRGLGENPPGSTMTY
jgi:hypothetical protein